MMVRETGTVLNESDIYREWEPPPGWRHAVACLWEQRVGAARVQRVLPDGHADLLFYGSGEVEIVGVPDKVAIPALAEGTVRRGMRLRPAAVGSALRVPGFALRNLTVAADDVLGAGPARRLADPDFLDRWVRGIEPDGRADAALQLLGAYRVEDVADLINISSRPLRRM